jgi:hypothetical protein
MNQGELETLIGRHLDGVASDKEVAALSDALENDEGARQRYLQYANLHATLATLEIGSVLPSALRPLPIWISWSKYHPVAAAASFAVLAFTLIATWAWVWSVGRTDVAPVVAHFGVLQDCRWVSPEISVETGDPIRMGGRIELSSGTAKLHFEDGAVATLVGPCIFEVSSANGGFLVLGQVKVVADTPSSKGFTVQTRTARFVDVGTEFVAASATDGQSRVDVTSGEVHVILDGIKTQHSLRTGDALSVEAGQPRVLVRIESGDGTADFRFPTIEPPSNHDWADLSRGKASIQILAGTLHSKGAIPSGLPELLLNGRGQSQADSPAESLFFDENASGALLLDLGQKISISKINTYSWHQNRIMENRVRAVQRFLLYGHSGDEPPILGDALLETGWVQLARVNSDDFFRVMKPIDRPAQQACSITGAHGILGRYRYLLWVVEPTQALQPRYFDNTFYAEFDIYGTP